MRTAKGAIGSILFDDKNNSYGLIISNIAALVEHVGASVKLIEHAIALEPGSAFEHDAGDIVVLDDLTPRYRHTRAALNTCYAGLGAALELLLDSKTPKTDLARRTDETAEHDLRAVRSNGRV